MHQSKHQNITDIQKYLPHRAPMLMVDTIDYIDAERVETSFCITSENPFLAQDFFSEVGLIENAAQTCSAIVGQGYFFDEEFNEIENVEVMGFISAIKSIEVIALPKVATKIVSKATLESKFESDSFTICTMHVEIYQAEALFLKGIMNLYLQKLP